MEHINVFIALTAVAIALQALVLLGIFLSLRKTSSKVDALTTEMRTRALPAVEAAQSLITTSAPKLEAIVSDVHTTTSLVRGQVRSEERRVGKEWRARGAREHGERKH